MDAVASPLRLSVPVAGGAEKLTVTLAVKVSSLGLFGVPLLLQAEILLTVIEVTEQVAAQGTFRIGAYRQATPAVIPAEPAGLGPGST